MRGVGEYAVVYDISSDRERGRVDKTLKDFGFRVQKSVFECRLDKRGKRELIDRLKDLNIQTGFIKIYRLEYQSRPVGKIIGKPGKPGIDDDAAFVV